MVGIERVRVGQSGSVSSGPHDLNGQLGFRIRSGWSDWPTQFQPSDQDRTACMRVHLGGVVQPSQFASGAVGLSLVRTHGTVSAGLGQDFD